MQKVCYMKKIFITLAMLAVIVTIFAPLSVRAEAISIWSGGYWAPNGLLVACDATSDDPLKKCDFCKLLETVKRIIYFAMSLLIYALAPLFLVVGGVMILFAGANPELISKGKKVLTGTVIGIAIALASFMIVDQIFSVVAGLRRTNIDWKNIQCDAKSRGIPGL